MAEARNIKDLSLEELAETERLESELDQFIEKRVREAKDTEKVDELWAKTVREHRESRRQANARAWYEHHDGLIRSHEDTLGSLVLYHQKERAHYARVLGLSEVGPEGDAV